jgi:predicted nucleic acid-binding protein
MIIIADSSPLICFAILKKLELLPEVSEEILVPPAVFDEVGKVGKRHAKELRAFLKDRVRMPQNRLAVDMLRKDLDAGEAEAIVLARELSPSVLLLDDFKARRIAMLNDLPVIGSIGVLLRLKEMGHIAAIRPELERLMRKNIRIGEELYRKALVLAGE